MEIRVDRRAEGGKKVFRPRTLAHADKQGYASVVFHSALVPSASPMLSPCPATAGADRSSG